MYKPGTSNYPPCNDFCKQIQEAREAIAYWEKAQADGTVSAAYAQTEIELRKDLIEDTQTAMIALGCNLFDCPGCDG